MGTESLFLRGKWRAGSQQGGLDTVAVCTPALPGSSGAFSHIPEVSLRVGDSLDWPHLGGGSCCHPLFAYFPQEEGASPGMSQTLTLLLRQPWEVKPHFCTWGWRRGRKPTGCCMWGTELPKVQECHCLVLVWPPWELRGCRTPAVAPPWPRAVLGPAPPPVQFWAWRGALCTLLRRID